MTNPFTKYLGDEDHLQRQVITWLAAQHPSIRYHHSPNEGKRSKFEQFKFKYLGSDAGFPDLFFPSLLMVIELKIKPNKPTPAQRGWLDYFHSLHWKAEVCYTFEDAISTIGERVKEMRLLADVYAVGNNRIKERR